MWLEYCAELQGNDWHICKIENGNIFSTECSVLYRHYGRIKYGVTSSGLVIIPCSGHTSPVERFSEKFGHKGETCLISSVWLEYCAELQGNDWHICKIENGNIFSTECSVLYRHYGRIKYGVTSSGPHLVCGEI